jgi:hypothetical protein
MRWARCVVLDTPPCAHLQSCEAVCTLRRASCRQMTQHSYHVLDALPYDTSACAARAAAQAVQRWRPEAARSATATSATTCELTYPVSSVHNTRVLIGTIFKSFSHQYVQQRAAVAQASACCSHSGRHAHADPCAGCILIYIPSLRSQKLGTYMPRSLKPAHTTPHSTRRSVRAFRRLLRVRPLFPLSRLSRRPRSKQRQGRVVQAALPAALLTASRPAAAVACPHCASEHRRCHRRSGVTAARLVAAAAETRPQASDRSTRSRCGVAAGGIPIRAVWARGCTHALSAPGGGGASGGGGGGRGDSGSACGGTCGGGGGGGSAGGGAGDGGVAAFVATVCSSGDCNVPKPRRVASVAV